MLKYRIGLMKKNKEKCKERTARNVSAQRFPGSLIVNRMLEKCPLKQWNYTLPRGISMKGTEEGNIDGRVKRKAIE